MIATVAALAALTFAPIAGDDRADREAVEASFEAAFLEQHPEAAASPFPYAHACAVFESMMGGTAIVCWAQFLATDDGLEATVVRGTAAGREAGGVTIEDPAEWPWEIEVIAGPGAGGAAAAVPAGSALGPGLYVVGIDIEPGIYRTAGPTGSRSSCYYARLSGLGGGTGDIIANGNTPGQYVLEVFATDVALELGSGCTWERVGEQ